MHCRHLYVHLALEARFRLSPSHVCVDVAVRSRETMAAVRDSRIVTIDPVDDFCALADAPRQSCRASSCERPSLPLRDIMHSLPLEFVRKVL